MTGRMTTTTQAHQEVHDETSSGTVLTKRVRQEDPVPDADGNKRLRSSEIHPDTDEPSGSDDGATAAIISVPSHTTDLAPTSALVAPNVPPMDDNSNVTHTGLAQRSGHATASTSATESVHSLPFWSRAQYLEHLKATTEPASIGQSNSIVFGYAMKRALKFLQAKPAAKPKIYMDAQTDGALIVLRNLHRAGMLTKCLDGYRLWIDHKVTKSGVLFDLRKYAVIAGATDQVYQGFIAGDPNAIRCRVSMDLKGFDRRPDTFVDVEDRRVRIQHYSVLAFLRLFYERIVECSSDDKSKDRQTTTTEREGQ